MPGVSSRASGLVVPPFDELNHKAAELRRRGYDIINLGQAVPGFGPPAAAVEAARLALNEAATHRYSADAGLLTLREALCDTFATERSIEARPDDIIITAGGNQAFMLAAMTLIDPGDDVVLAAPYFVNHEMAVRVAGATPIEAPIDESIGFAARWEDSHRNPIQCDGKNHVARFTVDQLEDKSAYGTLVKGKAWVQFCLFDDTTPQGNGTTDFGQPVSSMVWANVH